MTLPVVIPSKGRADTIGKYSLALFPHAIVTVDEREMADYKPVCANLLPHPPLSGISAIRNWLLDTIAGDFMMVDDDVRRAHSKVGKVVKYYSQPNDVMQIVENAYAMALGVGAKLFGFTQEGNILGFRPQDPLVFTGWIGTVIGIIGRGIRYDERLAIGSEDLDISLKHLLEHRIIFMDDRFHFESVNRLRAMGGNAFNRSLEREQRESEHLKRVWGKYIRVAFKESGTRVKSVRVQRRQAKV